jgi:hypothetical protein
MTSIAFVGFIFLTAFAVWEGTEQRLGTTDELRVIAGVFAAILIAAGMSVLGAIPT